ncbi:hypothetical protein Pan258_01650 [Symmachiella dynata]|uniref:hypothetical protein n=1 Tax=Symmachiella dynata TaxID=2527995 RepID=UPI0011892D4D|nr:hypothetical protein [Symmachiella dynata]QDT46148.1 hypothetical protein Pan258_01650 [Symmachiella dynata]
MANELIMGATQDSGKSNTALLRALFYMLAGYVIVCGDPQRKSTAYKLQQLANDHGQEAIFDSLGETERIIPMDWLIPSKSEDYWQAQIENKKEVEKFLDPLSRHRDLPHIQHNPLIREWSECLGFLMLYQNPRRPLADLKSADKPWLPSFNSLCDSCTDQDTKWKFLKLPKTPSVLERMIGPARRFASPVIDSAAVLMRDGMGNGYPIAEAVNNGIHYLMEGSPFLSNSENNFLLTSRSLELITAVEAGIITRPVVLILEEAEAARLISTFEENALKTLLKKGLIIIIVCQSPRFGDDRLNASVMQNTRKIIGRCNSEEDAEIGAKSLLGLLDEHAVHSREYRERMEHTGAFEEIPTSSVNSHGTTTESVRFQPVYRRFFEETIRYLSLNDQIIKLKQMILNLELGQFFVVTGEGVRLVKLPKVDIKSSDHETQEILKKRKQLYPYREPLDLRKHRGAKPKKSGQKRGMKKR